MPIFEYSCNSCGKEFETLVRGSAPAPECPACHGSELHKKLSTFAAITGSAATQMELPGPCGSCGHPDGPGACQFN
ncbi:MAG: zinc ribbon domain-containing protein [Betaproteobacteria bacterium]|nr:zinc ribbon domain-containing protein [Betaproteobacteria bacterium]